MKKLLLFTLVLFGILSTQSFAWNVGCGENVPISVCNPNWDGSSGGGGGSLPYGSVYLNPQTRDYGAVWNYPSGESANADAESRCGNACYGSWYSYDYAVISVSDDDKVVGRGMGYTYSQAMKASLKECEKNGGINCAPAIAGRSNAEPIVFLWGGLAYNSNTGDIWKARNHKKRTIVETELKKACGKDCLIFDFQENYGSLAVAPNGQAALGVSDKNLKDSDKEAVKNCKKISKAKDCKVIANLENNL